MTLTVSEEKRVQLLEAKLNEIQTNLNKLATRQQLIQLLSIRQSEIDDLLAEVNTLKVTNQGPQGPQGIQGSSGIDGIDGTALIDDNITTTTSTWSSQKLGDILQAIEDALVAINGE
jgi:hypothetical protein